MFEPLNVGLGITVDLTVELDVTTNHCCGIGWQAGLQDRPVGGSLCVGRRSERDKQSRNKVDAPKTSFNEFISSNGISLEIGSS